MRIIITTLLLAAHFAIADGVASKVIVTPVAKAEIRSEEGGVILKVSIKRFTDKDLTIKGKDENREIWFGDKRISDEIYGTTLSIVNSFELIIHGQKIKVPAEMWNTLVGFDLAEVKLVAVNPTAEETYKYNEALKDARSRPQITRSSNSDTIMITWERSADCDQTHTVRWLISKDGSILQHLDIPEHDC